MAVKTIECVYFKPSGKWYAEGTVVVKDTDAELIAAAGTGLIYPRDYGRALCKSKRLPGLASGTWSGPFAIKIDGGYQELCQSEKGNDSTNSHYHVRGYCNPRPEFHY